MRKQNLLLYFTLFDQKTSTIHNIPSWLKTRTGLHSNSPDTTKREQDALYSDRRARATTAHGGRSVLTAVRRVRTLCSRNRCQQCHCIVTSSLYIRNTHAITSFYGNFFLTCTILKSCCRFSERAKRTHKHKEKPPATNTVRCILLIGNTTHDFPAGVLLHHYILADVPFEQFEQEVSIVKHPILLVY